jgi:hypothetical protein
MIIMGVSDYDIVYGMHLIGRKSKAEASAVHCYATVDQERGQTLKLRFSTGHTWQKLYSHENLQSNDKPGATPIILPHNLLAEKRPVQVNGALLSLEAKLLT